MFLKLYSLTLEVWYMYGLLENNIEINRSLSGKDIQYTKDNILQKYCKSTNCTLKNMRKHSPFNYLSLSPLVLTFADDM